MKKKLSLLFLICILGALNINATVHYGSCGENVSYSLDTSTGVLSITGTGAMTNYDSSSSIPWYSKQSYVKTVEISDGVTSIGSHAFYGCSGLTSVTIGNSVTSIGNYAFYECSGLTSVTIPNSVTNIENDAFYECSGLTSVTIPNSVTSIGSGAFYSTAWYNNQPDGLVYAGLVAYKYKGTMPDGTSISIKEGTLSITGSAFSGCSGLTSITIPNSVTSIGSSAFSGTAWYNNQPDGLVYAGLVAYQYKGTMPANTSITIKEGTLGIGGRAFYGCSGLTSITIPNSVTSIGSLAFNGCSGLTSVTIPNSVTSIGEGAFSRCSGLTSVTIPNSVTSIGSSAFNRCSGLTSITIGNSVTSIGNSAFGYCFNLTNVTLNSNAIASKSYGSGSTLGNIFGEQVKEYVLGDEVKSIGSSAFSDCSGLTSVTIGNSVTSIGDYAFYNCSGLTSITIPNSVTSIGDQAFSGCSGLIKVILNSDYIANDGYSLTEKFGSQVKEYIIGNDVETIGNKAFDGCTDLTSLTIGSDVVSLGDYAIANIPKLEKIVCYANNVPTTTRTSFENSYIDYVTIYVPASSLDTYKSTAPWKNAASILPLEDIKEKCATPTIEYVDGKLSFSCETEGVKYVYNFSTPSESDEDGKSISMPNKLQVSVYAKKDGYENSDVATKEIDLGTSGIRGDVNNDGIVSMPDAMFIVNKILNGKFPDE